ncbi:Endoribonuclease L-PSP/chorismate mutase-like protein [Aspergillus filifer]
MGPSKIHIRTDKAPAPSPYLSQATVIGNIAFCSGQLGIDPKTGKMVEGTVKDPSNPQKHVRPFEACGSSLADVAKVNVFLADMKDFKDMNEIYMEGFPEPRPCDDFRAVSFRPSSRSDGCGADGASGDWIALAKELIDANVNVILSQARTCVAVKTLPQGSDVEIECSAVVTGSVRAKL